MTESSSSSLSMFPLIILGMHRSGTSLAASLLADAGLAIGDRLLEGNWSNPAGHFEDKDFIEFHRDALIRLGLDESGWLTLELPELSSDLVDRARTLINIKGRSGRPWGWKDPRTVLFLPLWSSVAPGASFAVVYRAPWEVIDSLYRRGDAAFVDNPELAVQVWLHCNRILLDLANAMPGRCVLANVDTIAADPTAWVDAVARRTGAPLRARSRAIYDPALHHRGQTAGDGAAVLFHHYKEVVELFAQLERHAFRPAGLDARPAWKAASADSERRLALRGWQAQAAGIAEDQRQRAPTPRAPRAPSVAQEEIGWCSCCRTDARFVETGTWLRDQYLCERCGSIPRYRAMNHTLDTYFPGWEEAAVHEFLPTNDFIRRHCRRYSSSGDDLERLPFAEGTFDLFVTQDALEHLLRPEPAVREIMRVVKSGGAHVFTVPKHKDLRTSRQRARVEHETLVHVLPPQYHGDPQHDPRALVTWDYGDDFELQLWNWCGYATASYVVRDRNLGLDGEYLDVFITRKFST